MELGCGGGQASVGFARALVDAGFAVERLLEPGSDDPDDYEQQMSHET